MLPAEPRFRAGSQVEDQALIGVPDTDAEALAYLATFRASEQEKGAPTLKLRSHRRLMILRIQYTPALSLKCSSAHMPESNKASVSVTS